MQSAKGPAPKSKNGLGTTTRQASEWKISIILFANVLIFCSSSGGGG